MGQGRKRVVGQEEEEAARLDSNVEPGRRWNSGGESV